MKSKPETVLVCALCGRISGDADWEKHCQAQAVECVSGSLIRGGSPGFRVLQARTASGRRLVVTPKKHRP